VFLKEFVEQGGRVVIALGSDGGGRESNPPTGVSRRTGLEGEGLRGPVHARVRKEPGFLQAIGLTSWQRADGRVRFDSSIFGGSRGCPVNESTDFVPSVSEKREWLTPTLTMLGDIDTLTEATTSGVGTDGPWS
jgi:hypothetical protein